MKAGRFSVFEATASSRSAAMFMDLERDPEIVVERKMGFPWIGPVRRRDAGPTVPPREVVNSARILVTAIKQAELDGHKIPNTVADACNWLDAALPSPGASDREAGR